VEQRRAALSDVEGLREKLRAIPEYSALAAPETREIEAGFASVLDAIGKNTLIAVIRECVNGFKSSAYPALLSRVTAPASNDAPKPTADGGKQQGFTEAAQSPAQPPTEYVAASELRVIYAKPYLASEQDVDAYLNSLRSTLIAEIGAGKRITI
jgi:hypothetical protein